MKRRQRGQPSRQRGVALIMVLLAFALATALAAGMYTSQHLMIYKASHYLDREQQRSLALGAEALAEHILAQDWKSDKQNNAYVDDYGEDWGKYAAALPVDNGVVQLQIDDLEGRFNLNDLLTATGQVDPVAKQRFERLLQVLEITSINVDKVIDWEDSNDTPSGATGAEDNYYLGLTPPYRAANRPFTSVTELRLIAGITEADYKKLLPNVSALPLTGIGFNVNTATGPVLRSLNQGITQAQAETILQVRADTPFKDITDFLARPEFAGLGLKNQELSVNSHFFRVAIRVTYDDQVYRLVSVLYRDDQGNLSVVSRDEGQRALITKKLFSLSQ